MPNAILLNGGSGLPTISPGDIYCTNIIGNRVYAKGEPDGSLDYYDNSGWFQSRPVGSTFTNGANPMVVTSLKIRTAGLENGVWPSNAIPPTALGPMQWTLRIYRLVSSNQAELLSTYNSQTNFTLAQDGDWFVWTGLSTTLAPNSTNAYTFEQDRAYNNWIAMAICSNTPSFFPGGQSCDINTTLSDGHYPVTYFSFTPDIDANFVIHLVPTGSPMRGLPVLSSPSNTASAGSPVTITGRATGSPALTYQWRTNGGGSAVTNIPGATDSTH